MARADRSGVTIPTIIRAKQMTNKKPNSSRIKLLPPRKIEKKREQVPSQAHASPNTFKTPYTSPTIPTSVKSPHIAISLVVHVDVFVVFTVEIKTFARMTTPTVNEMIPVMKFAIVKNHPTQTIISHS